MKRIKKIIRGRGRKKERRKRPKELTKEKKGEGGIKKDL